MSSKAKPLITRGFRGVAMVAGTPIRVAELARAYDQRGLSVEQLQEKIQFLTAAQIRQAIDYYHEHGDPCEEGLRQESLRDLEHLRALHGHPTGADFKESVWGKWPGTESDEELLCALEELS
jgi:uncharacterized protein (DUF433 family)